MRSLAVAYHLPLSSAYSARISGRELGRNRTGGRLEAAVGLRVIHTSPAGSTCEVLTHVVPDDPSLAEEEIRFVRNPPLYSWLGLPSATSSLAWDKIDLLLGGVRLQGNLTARGTAAAIVTSIDGYRVEMRLRQWPWRVKTLISTSVSALCVGATQDP